MDDVSLRRPPAPVLLRWYRLFQHPSFRRFLVVGASGFGADATLLWIAVRLFEIPPMPARLFSFSSALLLTYLLNRTWAFREAKSHLRIAEFLRYCAVQLAAGALNLIAYYGTLRLIPGAQWAPALGLVVGSAVGLLLNYLGARFITFVPRASCEAGAGS